MSNHEYICQKICRKLINLTNWGRNNLGQVALAFFLLGVIFLILGPFFKKDLFTASGSLFTASTLLYAICCYQKDAKEQNSKFYLEQIQKYLQSYTELVNERRELKFVLVIQNNIIWHKVIESLKATDSLREKLTEKPHIEIYLTDYINTAYSLIDIISKIDFYQFFFGTHYNNYHGDNSKSVSDSILYDTSKTCRIDPEGLYLLACFIDRAARISDDVNKNGTLITDCLNKNYFRKIDKNYGEFTIFAGVEIIREYIKAYNKCAAEEVKSGT